MLNTFIHLNFKLKISEPFLAKKKKKKPHFTKMIFIMCSFKHVANKYLL